MKQKLLMWVYKLLAKFHKRQFTIGYGLGALKDLEDKRDYAVGVVGIEVPEEIDMREFVPEVKSQGSLQSCVSHAICSSIEMQINMQDPRRYVPLSELYNYYYGRIESNLLPLTNSGMYPRDAIKSVKKDGIALEVAHPYNVQNYNKEPSSAAKSVAHVYSAMTKEYFRVFSDINMKEKLALGLPVIISVPVYGYWHSVDRGIVRKPIPDDKPEGSHMLLVVGYNQYGWICLNSWNKTNWGDKGFCYLPYGYEIVDRWVLVVE